MVLDKVVWIRADGPENAKERKVIVASALDNNFTHIIVRREDIDEFIKMGKFNPITITEGKIDSGDVKGEYVEIEGKEDEKRAGELAGNTDCVVIAARSWKVIPAENLIATFQKSGTKLLAEVDNVKDARLFLGTLEVGTDGIVLAPSDPNTINSMRQFMDELEREALTLVEGEVISIRPLGMGDRACVDSCSVMDEGEGMLIGSQSSGLFLVHSESLESEFVDTRPFRVNAGSVHSYILAKGDKTLYLSDLTAGDDILVVDSSGITRPVVLGRVKIEKRPLVLLEAKYQDRTYNIILQNAETIRLVSDGRPVSITELKVGDRVLMRVDRGGRHFGMKVDESIVEK